MDLDAYAITHASEWHRLDQLSGRRRLSGEEVDEMMELYDRVGTQLSVVRSSAPDADLVRFLSTILLRTRNRVEGSRTTTWVGVGTFFSGRFPAALYRLRWWWLSTMVLNVAVFTVVVLWFLATPALEDTLFDPGQVQSYVQQDFANYYSENPSSSFGARVWINNAWVSALCLALGVLGLPVIYLLLNNVVNVAIACGLMTRHGYASDFWGLILPHGMLELTVVFVAGGVGLRLFWSWIEPRERTRRESMAREGRTAMTVALGLVPVLALSAFVEAVVTPSGLPTPVRIGIGALAWIAFLAYALVLGRRAVAQGYDGDIAADLRGASAASAD